MRRKNITSEDVARLAKVSQSAESRTLALCASASDKTPAKVLSAAKKLGYRANLAVWDLARISPKLTFENTRVIVGLNDPCVAKAASCPVRLTKQSACP